MINRACKWIVPLITILRTEEFEECREMNDNKRVKWPDLFFSRPLEAQDTIGRVTSITN